MDGKLMTNVVSQLACVIKTPYGLYAPKGWKYYSSKPWTFDITKAKIYRNSSGAKNALRGSGVIAFVREFHTEMYDYLMKNDLKSVKEG